MNEASRTTQMCFILSERGNKKADVANNAGLIVQGVNTLGLREPRE